MSVPSQPPSLSKPSSPQKSTGAKFGAPPVVALLTTAAVAVGGVVAYVAARGATVTAMCGSSRMRPGNICETERNGIVTGTETYTEVLASALRSNQIIQWMGIAAIVIGVVFAALIVVRWRQDVALRNGLGSQYGTPASEYSKTAGTSLLGLVFGVGALGLAAFLLLTGLGKDEWGYFVGAAVVGLLGLLFLGLGFPKNGQLVQVFDAGVRVLAGGKQYEWPWHEVNYVITPAKGAANHSIGGPGLKQLPLTGLQGANALQDLAQQRSVEARYRPAIEAINRGETVSFGSLGVSRAGLTSGRKVLPWNEFGGVTLHQGNVTIAKVPKGRFASMSLGVLPNYALFVHLTSAMVKQQPS
ncbi:DUF6585 family protein [Pseudactinotalea sp.]|uniref:DUF6585 family protein n=1 Tax=Pseudactinotalea sp. TaxID=1926260 RepID=UPI003B3A326E